jgi:hypothetical protein
VELKKTRKRIGQLNKIKTGQPHQMKHLCRQFLVLLLSTTAYVSSGQDTIPAGLPVREPLSSGKLFDRIGPAGYLPSVKKGNILMHDSTRVSFTQLTFRNDSVSFYDSGMNLRSCPLKEVDQITRIRSNTAKFAVGGVIVGFIGGAITGGLVHPQRNFLEWLIDSINNEDNSPGISKEQAPFVIWGTIGGMAIGTIAGLLTRNEKTVFKNRPVIGLSPAVAGINGQKPGVTLTLRFNINQVYWFR